MVPVVAAVPIIIAARGVLLNKEEIEKVQSMLIDIYSIHRLPYEKGAYDFVMRAFQSISKVSE